WRFPAPSEGSTAGVRSLCRGSDTGSRERRLCFSALLPFQERGLVRIRVDRRGLLRREPAGVRGWTVRAVERPAQHARERRLLAAVVGGVGQAPARVLRVLLEEAEPRLPLRQRPGPHVDPEDAAEPVLLAHALVDHLLA